MAQEYVNDGKARMTTLTIYRGSDSSVYNFLQSFIYDGFTYPQITTTDLEMMSDINYQNRLNAFVNYVYSLHSGLDTDCPNLKNGAETYNTILCPLTPPHSQYEWEQI